MITTSTSELLSSSFTLSEIDSPFLESVRAEIDSLGGVCFDRHVLKDVRWCHLKINTMKKVDAFILDPKTTIDNWLRICMRRVKTSVNVSKRFRQD